MDSVGESLSEDCMDTTEPQEVSQVESSAMDLLPISENLKQTIVTENAHEIIRTENPHPEKVSSTPPNEEDQLHAFVSLDENTHGNAPNEETTTKISKQKDSEETNSNSSAVDPKVSTINGSNKTLETEQSRCNNYDQIERSGGPDNNSVCVEGYDSHNPLQPSSSTSEIPLQKQHNCPKASVSRESTDEATANKTQEDVPTQENENATHIAVGDSDDERVSNNDVQESENLEEFTAAKVVGAEKENDNKDEDEVIFVSQTPGDQNKKTLTLFKCVRCGHTSKSKAELNKHLLQDHKLIIVSKQKSVDCLFCSKKLEMTDFHQHLKSEHKVLLVKSKSSKSSASESHADSLKEKGDSSNNLIDLTCDDEEDTSKVASTNDADDSNNKSATMKSSAKSAPQKVLALPVSVPVRKSPRAVAHRKYTESKESSSSESEDSDTFHNDDNDDDDVDYDPNPRITPKKITKQALSKSTTSSFTDTGRKPIRMSVGKQDVSSPGQPSATTRKAPVNIAPCPSTNSKIVISASDVRLCGGKPASLNIQDALKTLNVNKTIGLNGQLYNMVQSGTLKYLIPVGGVGARTNEIKCTSTTVTTPPVPLVQSVPSAPTAPNLVLTQSPNTVVPVPPGNVLPTAVTQQPIILSSPSLKPGQTLYLQLPSTQTPNASTPMLQHSMNQTGQMFLPQPIQPVIQRPVHPGVKPSPAMSTIQPAVNPGVQRSPVMQAVTAILVQQTSSVSQTQSNLSSVNSIKAVHAVPTPVMQTKPALPSTSVSNSLAYPAGKRTLLPTNVSRPVITQLPATASKPLALKPAKKQDADSVNVSEAELNDPGKVRIAAPRDVKSSNFHKTGGLFALEVCLDTDTRPGTEPKREPRRTYMIQEKETVFEETHDEEEPVSETVESLDSEKSKTVVATAIARGHITPSDFSSISDKVLFECPKCNKCFPQHLLLCLHTKNCSNLAPSSSPRIKIRAPLDVVNKFFDDPPGGKNQRFIYCRFCRARILTAHDAHFVQLRHLSKHIEPKVGINILPLQQSGSKTNPSDCTLKALEWIDYIVPPFTLENPPTSSKTGLLEQYVSTNGITGEFKKKKKKKKKKHRRSDDDDDDDEFAPSRLSSLRSKTAPYIGSLRPKKAASDESQEGDGNHSSHNLTGSKHARTMMHSFKHVRSPNKRGSTLTAYIPIKAKHQDKGKQGDSAKRSNNGKTRSQHVHWRRQSRRYPTMRNHNTAVSDDSTPDGSVIQISSEEDGAGENKDTEGGMCDKSDANSAQDLEHLNRSDGPYNLTEDDFSDYLKLIDGAEEVEISSIKAPRTLSSKQKEEVEGTSDLVDYYGNDAESSLGCEPLIMEPEQVLCYFKSSHNKMECQIRDCDADVPKNIRTMLAHIRVHFQILVPAQLLAKCGSQFPRQSIPRPLRLTFSQVEAHFVIADMQEANLHLGEVQQLYTCMWKGCSRPRCYKKNILQHLIKHIFFALISKEEYQEMAKSMSDVSSSSGEGVVKKLRIVAMNKSGQKIALVVTIPASQMQSPDSLKAAIKKSLASQPSMELPANVMNAIVSKFTSSWDNTSQQDLHGKTSASQMRQAEKTDAGEEANFLTEAELDGLKKKFPFLVAKLNLTTSFPQSTKEDSNGEQKDGGQKDGEKTQLTPLARDQRPCTARDLVDHRRAKNVNKNSILKLRKTAMPLWKTVYRGSVPRWTVQPGFKRGDLQIVRRHSSTVDHGTKRKCNPECTEDQPQKKRENTGPNEHNEGQTALKTLQDLGPMQVCSEDDTPAAVNDASPVDIRKQNKVESDKNVSPDVQQSVEYQSSDSKEVNDLFGSSGSDPLENSPPPTAVNCSDVQKNSQKLSDSQADEKLSDLPADKHTANSCQEETDTLDEDSSEKVGKMTTSTSHLHSSIKAQSSQTSCKLKTSLVLGLSATQIVKAFRFCKAQKKQRVQVPGRGYGLGVLRCRMAHCHFFQEVMRNDVKAKIVEALAVHLRKAHLKKCKQKALVFYWNKKKMASIPSSKFTQALKDLPTGEAWKKFRLSERFQQIPKSRARIAGVGAWRARLKGQRFLKCISSGCLFASFNPSKHTLISHLQTHLYHEQMKELQVSVKKSIDGGNDQRCEDSKADDPLASCLRPGMEEQSPSHSQLEEVSEAQLLGASRAEMTVEEPHDAESAEDIRCRGDDDQSRGDSLLPDIGQCSDDNEGPSSAGPDGSDVPASPPPRPPPTVTVVPEQAREIIDPEADDPMDTSNDDGTIESRPDTFSEPMELDNQVNPSEPIKEEAHAEEMELEKAAEPDTSVRNGSIHLHEQGIACELDSDAVVPEAISGDETKGADASHGEEKMKTVDCGVLPPHDGDGNSAGQNALTPHSDLSMPSRSMDELASRPGDTVKMFYDELQSYFTCYTNKISQTKEFGMKCFSCPKCEKRDLRGESLPRHLQLHIGKAVQLTSLDSISTDPQDDVPSSEGQQSDDGLPSGSVAPSGSVDDRVSPGLDQAGSPQAEGSLPVDGGYEESHDTILISEEEMLKRFFERNMNINAEAPVPFGRETLKCRTCEYKTMTIMDTPSHVEQHVKKTVLFKNTVH